MLTQKTDILIIGSGCAGMMAAVAAAGQGLEVMVVDKGLIAKSGASVSAQQLAAVLKPPAPGDSPALHMQDTVTAGQYLNNQELVHYLTGEAGKTIRTLEEMGLILSRERDGGYALSPMNGHSRDRSLFAGDLTGKAILDILRNEAWRRGVKTLSDCFVFRLLLSREQERVAGALALDCRHRSLRLIRARAVIIATGSTGQLYPLTTNPVQSTGDGLALALQAGAAVIDMEMFQFYPAVVLTPPELRGTVVGIAQFSRLLNSQGERFMTRYEPEQVENTTRDRLSWCIYNEIQRGYGTENGGVYLDATGLPEHVYQWFAHEYDLFRTYGLDLRQERLEILPGAHYYMGGIRIDNSGRSTVQGLYAAGEVAGGVHGANRLGNNSLTDTIVFGARAGETALREAGEHPLPPLDPALVVREQDRLARLAPRLISHPARVRRQIQDIMWNKVGIIRNGSGLGKALAELMLVRDALYYPPPQLQPDSFSFPQGPALVQGLENLNLALVGEAAAMAALLREESRGAHQRSDFPASDNSRWLVNSCTTMNPGGELAVTFHPVNMSRLSPAAPGAPEEGR